MSLIQKVKIMRLRYEKCMNSKAFKAPLRNVNDDYLKIDSYVKKMENLITIKHKEEKTKYVELVSKLDAMSPLKTLTRGYSLVEKENKLIKSVNDLKKGDNVKIRLVDGEKKAEIL